ncbi:TIM barrel protein [Candidatus Woesearchaeota archaeon]|nr:TIM barrel protein [Candidatus Woesearchaeota archaeon]
MAIRIGPAGTGGNSIDKLKELKELGLDAVEMEFVRGVVMSNELAGRIKEENKKHNIVLSIHAPYYLNLASEDKVKIEASKKRILDSCERGHHMGARCIVFHAAFYGKLSPEECFQQVKNEMLEMQEVIRKNNWEVILCPETTGKRSQFGDLDELMRMMEETGCGICIDFAHIEARHNKEPDYNALAKKIKAIKNLHSHYSGISYTEKGERRHLPVDKVKAKKLLSALKAEDIDITMIIESPDTWGDAVMMKRLERSL